MAHFLSTLPAMHELIQCTEGPYKAEGVYAQVQAQASVWAPTHADSIKVKTALGDCDYYAFPRSSTLADQAGFVDFKNADGGTGKP